MRKQGSGSCACALSGNSPKQSVQGVGIGKAKINPSHSFQKKWEIGGCRGFGKKNRDYRARTFHKLTEKCVEFLVLPRADAFGTHKDRSGLHICNLLLEDTLPGQTWA